jgi:hypothetical protein
MDGFEVMVVLLFLFDQVCVRKLRNMFVRVLSLDHESMCCTPQLPARIASMSRREENGRGGASSEEHFLLGCRH